MRQGLVLVLLLGVVSAGCQAPTLPTQGPADGPGREPPTADADDGTEQVGDDGSAPPPEPTPTSDPQPGPSATPGAQPSPPPTEQAPWPPVDDATIRPGVRTYSDAGQCTSNFVFMSPDNATLYLGSAAHCVEGHEEGDYITIDGAQRAGKLVYTSWNETACANDCDLDFAMIEIDHRDRGRVHPAMRYFGGPTGLVDARTIQTGDCVLSYGNSGARQGVEESNWHEGFVEARQGGPTDYTFEMRAANPGIPGDSGSPVIMEAGEAVGVLVTVVVSPSPGANGVTGLAYALELMQEQSGLVVELATWPVMEDGFVQC